MVLQQRKCRVDILTKDAGLLLPAATGLPVPIQAARVVVTSTGASRSHVVVRAAAEPWQLPPDVSISSLFPADVVSLVQKDVDQIMILSCTNNDELEMFSAACAAATLKRSWGWDESPTIVVNFTTGKSFALDPVFRDGAWNVAESAGV